MVINGLGIDLIGTDRLSRAFVLSKRKKIEEVAVVARLLSRVPAQNCATSRLEEGVAPWSVVEVGGDFATAFSASLCGGGVSRQAESRAGVEVAIVVVVVVIVVGGRIVAVDVAVAVVVAVGVAVVNVGPVSCAIRPVGVAFFLQALGSAGTTPLAVCDIDTLRTGSGPIGQLTAALRLECVRALAFICQCDGRCQLCRATGSFCFFLVR